ncbi:MAG TPA: Ig-like domain repeat protein [Thermoanaerobaculia bacterium]|jgi:hypothetical protein|nr:Ig-like domain repeat protein [Thermoanaerobaculia bacterium]
MRVPIILAVTTCFAVNAVAATVTLNPSADNTMYSENGTLSNGAGSYFFAGKTSTGATRRALIKFDLSTIPTGSTITAVTLDLHQSRVPSGATSQTFSLYRVLANWGEGAENATSEEGQGAPATANSATWTHRFYNTSLWTTAGGDFSPTITASKLVGTTVTDYRWDSTSQMVADDQGWLDNPATNFGWLLRNSNESPTMTARRFDSKENASTSVRPRLTVTYTAPGAASLTLSSPSTATGGEPFDVTVTARDGTGNPFTGYRGTVHFSSSDTAAALPADYTFTANDNGAHTFAITLNTAGSRSITVSDTANGTLASTAIVVVRGNTTTALTSSANPSVIGESVTFTATVTSSTVGTITGTVTFKDGSTTIGTGTLSSPATFTTSELSAGSHSITAVYEGDANFNTSTSPVLTQNVGTAFGPPTGFSATATSTTSVSLSWLPVNGATSYEVHRSPSIVAMFDPLPMTTNTSMTDTTVSSGVTYLYKVQAIGSEGRTAFSNIDLATTVTYIDSALAGVTIKAEDMERLRTAVNAVRASANRPTSTFTDGSLAEVVIKRLHLIELRNALDEARQGLGFSPMSYTDSVITAGATPVRAAHWMEIRTATQ